MDVKTVRSSLGERVRAVQADQMLVNSWLMLLTNVLMAGAGSLFWVIAARLRPEHDVGLAGSLVSTGEAIAVVAQLGLNIALLRTMPSSSRKRADLVVTTTTVALVAAVIAFGYALVLPWISTRLADVIPGWWRVLVLTVLFAAVAVVQFTDSAFLAINRVKDNLMVNGVLMGVVKCSLPFLLAGGGALGLYGSVGGAALIGAIACCVLLWIRVPGNPGQSLWRPSPELWDARRLAGAGHLAVVLFLIPQMLFPVLIINSVGPGASGVYFVCFQISTLLNVVVYTTCDSMFAEASRDPARTRAIVRTAARHMFAQLGVGVVGIFVAGGLLLSIFGGSYAEAGVTTLRVLALGSFGIGLEIWAMMRLRLAHALRALMLVQALTTTAMVLVAMRVAHHGIVWVAVVWGVGHLSGGVIGYLTSRALAPLHDAPEQVSH